MNKDTIIGIAGSFVLVAAMVGVFMYEKANASTLEEANPSATTDAWNNVTVDLPAVTGVVALSGDTTKIIDVTNGNLTRVTFRLTWTATNGQDTLKLLVEPPEGSAPAVESQEEDDGTIEVTVNIPGAATPPHTMGQGEWKLTVSYPRGSGLIPAAPQPIQPDPSVQWRIQTAVTSQVPESS